MFHVKKLILLFLLLPPGASPVVTAATEFYSTDLAENFFLVTSPSGKTLVVAYEDSLVPVDDLPAEQADDYLAFTVELTGPNAKDARGLTPLDYATGGADSQQFGNLNVVGKPLKMAQERLKAGRSSNFYTIQPVPLSVRAALSFSVCSSVKNQFYDPVTSSKLKNYIMRSHILGTVVSV